MHSYEQIDREHTAYVKAANKAVTALSEVGFRWWNYSVSLSSFTILIGDASAQRDNVVIFLASCEYISGPVNWLKPHQLEVVFNSDRTKSRDVWEFVVQDKSAGFRAMAGVFEWRKNYDLLNLKC